MEGFRTEENRPDMSDLLLALREKTDEDLETRKNLELWMSKQQQAIEAVLDTTERMRAQIGFERKMAKLHHAAGYTDAALQDLQDARDLAIQENLDDVAEEIEQEMASLE